MIAHPVSIPRPVLHAVFLALDIGNSSVKVGRHDGARWRVAPFVSDPSVPATAWADRLRDSVGGASVRAAGLASVVPALTGPLAEAVHMAFGVEPGVVSGTMPIPDSLSPFRVGYATPATLGADRLAVAAAAFARFRQDEAGRARSVVALDAGTAATVEAVTAGGLYLGGAILPGPDALRRALARGTAQLPEVGWPEAPPAVGRATVGAIESGLFHLFVGGVGHLLDATSAALAESGGSPPFVIATGGWGGWLAGRLPAHIHAAEPHLVLEGVRLLVEEKTRSV